MQTTYSELIASTTFQELIASTLTAAKAAGWDTWHKTHGRTNAHDDICLERGEDKKLITLYQTAEEIELTEDEALEVDEESYEVTYSAYVKTLKEETSEGPLMDRVLDFPKDPTTEEFTKALATFLA